MTTTPDPTNRDDAGESSDAPIPTFGDLAADRASQRQPAAAPIGEASPMPVDAVGAAPRSSDRLAHPVAGWAFAGWIGGFFMPVLALIGLLLAIIAEVGSRRAGYRPGLARFVWIAVIVQICAGFALASWYVNSEGSPFNQARWLEAEAMASSIQSIVEVETLYNDGPVLQPGRVYAMTTPLPDGDLVVDRLGMTYDFRMMRYFSIYDFRVRQDAAGSVTVWARGSGNGAPAGTYRSLGGEWTRVETLDFTWGTAPRHPAHREAPASREADETGGPSMLDVIIGRLFTPVWSR